MQLAYPLEITRPDFAAHLQFLRDCGVEHVPQNGGDRMSFRVLLVGLALIAASSAWSEPHYTYVDLVHRLTDLQRLATPPEPGNTMAQWSSYDRASTYDPATDSYLNWGANDDGTGIIREENGQQVMAEMTGPGCIWRIWSARAEAGHVRIYLDGAAEPVVDLPFSGYFDGKNGPFVYPSLVYTAALGLNCYVPIPYQKSCKIVADKGWGMHFHFGYETFPEGTVVPTFQRNLGVEESAPLQAASDFLSSRLGSDPAGIRAGEQTITAQFDVAPGEKTVLAQAKGAGALTSLRVSLVWVPAEQTEAALRELALSMKWDGEAQPSVWTPLGDFFGTGPGVNKYKSLPLGMSQDGFYSFWYMPFSRGAVIELQNDGANARSVQFTYSLAPLSEQEASSLLRFHAMWHRDAFLPERADRWPDWTLLQTTGRGRYCGVALNVWSPRGGWWGEGDEKFFVDGEKFPST